MILGTATIVLGDRALPCDGYAMNYSFDTDTNEHVLDMCCESYRTAVPGELINQLIPYRDRSQIRQLISWLNKADHLRSLQ